MFKNYIKTAIRSLGKNKGFTAINVLGLALGLSICLLIVFYVVDELSYDKFNTKLGRIYRINNEVKFGGNESAYAVTPAPLAAALQNEFPEVEKAVRFRQAWGFVFNKGYQRIQENGLTYADAAIFNVFTLPMMAGNPATALKEPYSIVITEKIAKKYFGSQNVIGKTLVANDTINYKVTGVIQEFPKQSHMRFNFLISMATLPESKEPVWVNNNFYTYVLLKPGADVKHLQKQLPSFVKNHLSAQVQTLLHISYDDLVKGGSYFRFSIIPLKNIHLQSNLVAEIDMNGNIQYIYIFSAIAIFILLIACVNFMNLSTARSANRAREVGVRKVLGSSRKHLIFQFLAESIIVTMVATILALVVAWLLLPVFNQMAGKELQVTIAALTWLIPAAFTIILVIGLLAGSYPAFFLSGFQPIEVLKGKLAAGFKGGALRSFLVVLQFSISIFLIIGTLVIYSQLKYIRQKDIGYNRSHVLLIKNVNQLGAQAQTFKLEIKQMPSVKNATLTGYTPFSGWGNSNTLFQTPTLDSKTALNAQTWDVDADYLNTLKIKLSSGRNFSKDMATDSSAIIINETASKKMGTTNPLNKILYLPQDHEGKIVKPYYIVGVVKDFNFTSLRENVSPLALMLKRNNGSLSISLAAGSNLPAAIAQLENKWKAINPNAQFNYSFMDQDFDTTYRAEQRIGKIFVAFTSLAIIIACLGLFGLAAYAAEQRTKEIGIRKVLGASLSSIVGMLSKDFIKLVLISIAIAAPLAWLAMQHWLQGFAYRQNVQYWVIAAAGAGAIFIAFITISFQSVKAALLNPVKSLKSE